MSIEVINLNSEIKKNLKTYVNWLPFLGMIIGIIVFLYAYFIANKELIFSILFASMCLVIHLMVWLPANIIFKKN